MGKEIKFRVWDKVEKRYRRIVRLNYDDGELVSITVYGPDDFAPTILPLERVILEQSTGLKDKNGKEIYEGDIVKQFVCGVRKFKGKECGRRTVWQVRWNEEECCFELHYLSGSLFGDSMMAKGEEYEVIGNIHENPELIGSEHSR